MPLKTTARFLIGVARVCRRCEDTLLALLLAVMVLLAVVQIVQRNLFGSSFIWSDELLRILVLWLTLIGAMVASRSDQHIQMDILIRWVPPLWRGGLRRLVHALTALVCGVLAWHAVTFVAMEAEFQSQALGGYPAWWFESILPVGFGLMSWRYLLLMLHPPLAQLESPNGDVNGGNA
ncbi:MAG: TRAP transporter small permease [Desulfuromonadaceae bacterium]|nr:TRAP transporter small permease [Desulfuromonadaceae bacterium]